MKRKRLKAEQIILTLRQAEIQVGKGIPLGEVCRNLGITENTYYRWRRAYGGMTPDQARRIKELETENGRLKKIVADLSLDNAMLKEVAQGNF